CSAAVSQSSTMLCWMTGTGIVTVTGVGAGVGVAVGVAVGVGVAVAVDVAVAVGAADDADIDQLDLVEHGGEHLQAGPAGCRDAHSQPEPGSGHRLGNRARYQG